MSDSALYQDYKGGDQSAMVALVNRYHQPIFDFLYRFTGNAALADDLCQEVFIRIMHYDGKLPSNFRAWLYTIARNLARDFYRSAYYRREQSTGFELEMEWIQSQQPTPEQKMMVQESASLVATALQKLPIEQRDVVILRFYHDMALADIAAVTDAPPGTVKSRLFHGLKKLKRLLETKEGLQT